MNKIAGSISLLLLALSVQGANIFPLPPFTVYGKVRDWDGRALSSADAATVIVKDTNGVELARCDVKSGAYPAVNYRVQIPMASGPLAGRWQVGDPLKLSVFYDGQPHTVSADIGNLVVGNPAGTVSCSLSLGTFSYTNALPDEYLALLRPYYDQAGRPWDPAMVGNDDFDFDGFSNLQEFWAGTIPVLGTDYPRITGFSQLANGYLGLSFLSAPGRTYTVPVTAVLASNLWNEALFAMATNASPAQTFYASEQDASTTVYLQQTNNTPAFYRVKVQ